MRASLSRADAASWAYRIGACLARAPSVARAPELTRVAYAPATAAAYMPKLLDYLAFTAGTCIDAGDILPPDRTTVIAYATAWFLERRPEGTPHACMTALVSVSTALGLNSSEVRSPQLVLLRLFCTGPASSCSPGRTTLHRRSVVT